MKTNFQRDNRIISFAKSLASIYSNYEQALKNPRNFSHINVYFIPLPWEIYNGPSFYSEQSFNHNKWVPYLQSIIKLYLNEENIVAENYSIIEAAKYAGSGEHNELLKGIAKSKIVKRDGCSIYFKEIYPGTYRGRIKEGNQCLINRGNKQTYLISEVELDEKSWKSLDRGINLETNLPIKGTQNLL